MPVAWVYCKNRAVKKRLADVNFAESLREAVTNAVNCADEGGRMQSDDVDVFHVVRLAADDTKWDVTVVVDARRTPTREQQFAHHTGLLAGELGDVVPEGLSIAVCINLVNTAWAVDTGRAIK